MQTHLEQELENVKSRMFEMADLAIEAIANSVESLRKADTKLAETVIRNDDRLDRLEILLDEECIRILVTKQPAAVDLRLVLAILKINTDLERMGDLATGIARETITLDGKQTLKPLVDIPRMAAICMDMIKDALLSITELNADRGRKVIERDKEIDELNIQIFRELFSFMAENPRSLSPALGLIMVAKALERIGDHATNIAERAVYYIEGKDIRHQE